MKALILAGSLGTRISVETHLKPKPTVEIGGRPILRHILKTYSSFSVNEFLICCGHKGYVLKEYFANYFLHMSDVTFHVRTNSMEVHQKMPSPVRSPWWIPGKPPLREAEPLQRLAAEGQLQAYRHHGYWQPMDTLRDRVHLEELWVSGKAPWKRSKP